MTLSPRRPSRVLPTRPSARPAARPLAVVGVLLALTGCSATNPMTSMNNYEASDGIRVELGDVVGTNLLILTAGEGEPGTMLGALTNQGQDEVELTLALAGGQDGQAGAELTSVTLGAGDTVIFGPERATDAAAGDEATGPPREALDLEAVPAPPGALADLTLTSDRAGTVGVRVPVLDGTLPEYTDLVPGGEGSDDAEG